MVKISFYEADHVPGRKLTYSIIASKYLGKWIFVRHHLRKTFEIPGGHIEADETPFEAAERELKEETGAIDFKLDCICTYSVESDDQVEYGRLYLAEISKIGPVMDTFEIEEIIFQENLPEMLTYPEIQPFLFQKVTGNDQR